VRHQDWKRALLVIKFANAEDVLRVLKLDLPPAATHDIARTALEHAFDLRAVWPDAERAKEVVCILLEKALGAAPDPQARIKTLKQARARTQRVIAKGGDFFMRELAFALDDVVSQYEASMR